MASRSTGPSQPPNPRIGQSAPETTHSPPLTRSRAERISSWLAGHAGAIGLRHLRKTRANRHTPGDTSDRIGLPQPSRTAITRGGTSPAGADRGGKGRPWRDTRGEREVEGASGQAIGGDRRRTAPEDRRIVRCARRYRSGWARRSSASGSAKASSSRLSGDGEALQVRVPDEFFRDRIRRHYTGSLLEAAEAVAGPAAAAVDRGPRRGARGRVASRAARRPPREIGKVPRLRPPAPQARRPATAAKPSPPAATDAAPTRRRGAPASRPRPPGAAARGLRGRARQPAGACRGARWRSRPGPPSTRW